MVSLPHFHGCMSAEKQAQAIVLQLLQKSGAIATRWHDPGWAPG